ncbi:sensor domain-containing protein [Embleya sp. NPDC005575]|uniref:sensor histidine kinase n=1 Tax=Embleya sp. NPDC005575 TaxID=3156892 RepID=UPI0033A34A12
MQPRTIRQALPQWGYLVSGWPWRATGYLLSSALPGGLGLILFAGLAALGGVLSLVLVGLPLLVVLGFAGIPLGVVERRRLRLVDFEPAADPHPLIARRGPRAWLLARGRERATWRELGYALLLMVVLWPLNLLLVTVCVGVPGGLITAPIPVLAGGGHRTLLPGWTIGTAPQALAAVPVGLLAMVVGAYLLGLLASAQATSARRLLTAPGADLGERLVEVTRSRARLVDAFESERRRIERDLHDGAQQRLVALTMTLGLARIARGEEAAALVAKAHEHAKLALGELRELVRGIHPQVLTDRGLPAAVADVAERSAIPVDVAIELPGRLPEPIEAAAYFVVCEALTNVAKHSGARRAGVSGHLVEDAAPHGELLVIEVRDDGTGGAVTTATGGLGGLADRVAVLDGRMLVSSPAGGPTLLRVEIPCSRSELSAS